MCSRPWPQPGYEKLVRAALCTDALGLTGERSRRFQSRRSCLGEGAARGSKNITQLWRERGFIQMLRHLAAEHGVRQRLLSYPDGERRLTNFLHLAELLHARLRRASARHERAS